MKKQIISTLTATALVASVIPAVTTEAATITKVQSVSAIDTQNVKVTYVKAGKKYSKNVKTAKVIKDGARTVQFKLEGKTYTQKLSKPFVNKNYKSLLSQIDVAQTAIKKGQEDAALKAIQNAQSLYAKVKSTEVSSAQYKSVTTKITALKKVAEQLQSPISPEDFSVAEVMKKAQEKMNAVQSMDSKITTIMKISAAGETLNMNMSGSMSMFVKPMKMKTNLVMDLGELGKESMEMYMEESNGKMYTYTKSGGQWTADKIDMPDMAGVNNTQLNLEDISNVKALGVETIAGKKAYVVSATVLGSDMEKLIQATGVLDTAALPTTQGQAIDKEMFKDLGDISMKMWIDAEDSMVMKYEIDMTDMMQKMMTKIMAQLGGEGLKPEEIAAMKDLIKVEKFVMSMANENFDKVASFEIPAEAKAALK